MTSNADDATPRSVGIVKASRTLSEAQRALAGMVELIWTSEGYYGFEALSTHLREVRELLDRAEREAME